MRRLLTTSILLLFGTFSFAQQLNIFELSNTAGAAAVNTNPAMMADSRTRWSLSLATASAGFDASATENQYNPLSRLTMKQKGIAQFVKYSEINGPAFLYQFHNGNAFAISSRYRSAQEHSGNLVNLFNTDVLTGDRSYSGSGQLVGMNEWALSYAHPYAYKAHFIKAGASFKLFSPLLFTEVGSNNLSLSANNFNGELSGLSNDLNSQFKIGDQFKNIAQAGKGFSWGLVYEFRPKYLDYEYTMNGKQRFEPAEEKHLIRVGFSMTDIGRVNSQLNSISGSNINNSLNSTAFDDDLSSDLTKLMVSQTSNSTSKEFQLPTQSTYFAEFRLGKKGWNLGTLYRSEPKTSDLLLARNSIWAIYPKFDAKGLDFSLPLIRNENTKKWSLGFHLKLGGIILGTEAINAFFGQNRPAPTFYAGVNFYKLAKKRKDKDGDTISDSKDDCIDTPGIWSQFGCPDTDGDGIKDSEDRCPDHAGPVETQGCPDTDGDGVFDSNDSCPNLAGPAQFNGCPDSDGDGLPDHEDDCPDKPGKEEFGGCPDTDGDGLIDSEDHCPELPGSKLLQGCPDSDGDGIADKDDQCPDQKGSLANGGCPDTDGDGILDKNDECPEVAGLAALGGCPDTDGDGIKDTEDECPTEKGSANLKGCPDKDGDEIADKNDDCPNIAGSPLLGGCALVVQLPDTLEDTDLSLMPLKAQLTLLKPEGNLIDTYKVRLANADPKPRVIFEGSKAIDLGKIWSSILKEAGFEVEIKSIAKEQNTVSIE